MVICLAQRGYQGKAEVVYNGAHVSDALTNSLQAGCTTNLRMIYRT